jgi:peptide/nickel transport system substrate-binding protein
LKLAIDRQAIIDTVLSSHGSIANDNPIGAFSPNFANLEQRQYDPDRAKFHLKQAGYEELSVDLHVSNIGWGGVNAVDGAVLYKENAAKAGIELKVVRESDDGYWTRMATMSFRNSNWNGRPSDEMMFTTAHMGGAPGNEDNWMNKRFNEVLAAVKAELDEGKRREMNHELQQLIRDDGGVIIPAFANIVSGTSDRIQHGDVGPDWELDGARHIERWWFA